MLSVKTFLAGAACATLLSAAPALAQTPAAAGPQTPNAKQTDPNRVICQKTQETGSRIGAKKICMTAQQWEEQRQRDRQYLEDAQQRSLEPNSSG